MSGEAKHLTGAMLECAKRMAAAFHEIPDLPTCVWWALPHAERDAWARATVAAFQLVAEGAAGLHRGG